jgi:hypothetical protein
LFGVHRSTKFQTPAFAPQGGAPRRQAQSQINSNEPNAEFQMKTFGHWNWVFGNDLKFGIQKEFVACLAKKELI